MVPVCAHSDESAAEGKYPPPLSTFEYGVLPRVVNAGMCEPEKRVNAGNDVDEFNELFAATVAASVTCKLFRIGFTFGGE